MTAVAWSFRALWLVVGVLVAGPLGAASVEPSSAPSPLTVIDRGRTGAVLIRWRARIGQDGGRFRLYAGSGRDSLRLIGERPAAAGVRRYDYSAAEPALGKYFFELRFVHQDGTEEVLETALVRHRGLSPIGALAPASPTSQAVEGGFGGFATTASAEPFLAAGGSARRSRELEPETPPPRG